MNGAADATVARDTEHRSVARAAGAPRAPFGAEPAGRQAAPFSKGWAKDSPKPPGRKPGTQYGRQATRPVPAKVDQHILVGCPLFCPHCDGEVRVTGKTDQYQTELPRPRAVTRHFEIHVGRCTACGGTVQGRHRLQTPDAKEVGTVQL